MNRARQAYTLYYTDPLKQLTCKNKLYQKALYEILKPQLFFDVYQGDVTTQAVCRKKLNAVMDAYVIAKESGVIAGVEEVAWFIQHEKKIKIISQLYNGTSVKKGDVIIIVRGSVKYLMMYERMILNMIAHCSGIASYTQSLIHRTKKYTLKKKQHIPLLACTRKTRFGLIDKRSCAFGGGGLHRLHLADAVIIKHNHIQCSRISFKQLIHDSYLRACTLNVGRFFEVEVTTDEELFIAAEFFQNHAKKSMPGIIMLDNFSSQHARDSIAFLDTLFSERLFLIECSGGITKKNLYRYIKTGADVLSLGSIVYDASFFNVSMKVSPTSSSSLISKKV